MNVPKYPLKAERKFRAFEFISQGINGNVKKLILFQETNEPNLFNLAFGDKTENNKIDDLNVTNNGDTEKVLATVVSAVYAFFDKHPNVFLYATGSTDARTRLYRMGITKYYEEMQNDFYLYGQVKNEFYPFEIGKVYDGFLVQRKFY